MDPKNYPIGTPGKKWGDEEKAQWLASQSIKRSYRDEVLTKLQTLNSRFNVEQYGSLSFDAERYPLFVVKTKEWNSARKNVLVTGGVHGYETSGVQGAIRFLEVAAEQYVDHFNIIVAPCVSPWGYETINRWNPGTVDPNRSFCQNSQSEEATTLMAYISSLQIDFSVQIDLHETTDTDKTEFGPALAARDAEAYDGWDNIPDGFYLVAAIENPQADFQKAMIDAVEKVTHIAPPDRSGNIVGSPLSQKGVVNFPVGSMSLCAGFTDATYSTTTEVYPDSPNVDSENCIQAQLAAVKAGLDYVVEVS